MDEARVSQLIESIYASAFEENGWGRLLHTLRTEFHAATITSVGWRKTDAVPVFTATTLSDQSFARDYENHYHAIDPGVSDLIEKIDKYAQMGICSRFDGFPFADYPKTEFYCDFAKHIDMGQSMMAIIDSSQQVVANIHMYRPLHGNEFSCQEKNLLSALRPHLNRGLKIYREMEGLRAKAGLFADALDAHGGATFMLDTTGKPLFLNQAAQQLMSGGTMGLRDGCLIARHPEDNAALQAALRPPQPGMAPAEIMLRATATAPALRLSITPVNGGHIPLFFDVTHTSRAAFMLTATPLGPTAEHLIAAHGLTRAEAEITLLLLQGAKAAHIAAARDTSIGTVNTQLKNIYAKTDVAGHVELLVKLMRR